MQTATSFSCVSTVYGSDHLPRCNINPKPDGHKKAHSRAAGDVYVRLATSKEAKEASHPSGVVGGRGAPEQVVNLLKGAQE